MEFSLSKTNRNKPLLILKGFHYVIHRGGSNSVNWRCCRYNYCKATLKTNKEITCIVEDNTENHTHELENTNSRENKENLKSIIELNPYAKPEQISLMYSECSSSTRTPQKGTYYRHSHSRWHTTRKKCKKNILRNEAVKWLYDEYRLRIMSINDYLHGIQSNIRVD